MYQESPRVVLAYEKFKYLKIAGLKKWKLSKNKVQILKLKDNIVKATEKIWNLIYK